jgi:hypothetical protein
MQLDAGSSSGNRSADAILITLGLISIGLHLATNGNYGIFRDELYYLACSDHPAWGYVDHPPLSIIILRWTKELLGDSVAAIRLPVALVGGAAVFLVGRLARELGGGRTAQWIAASAYLVTGTSLVFFGFFSMNAFDALAWIICALIAARLLNGGSGRWWLALGLTVGIGLLNKYSIGFFIAAFVLALLPTAQRHMLGTAGPWIGGAIAAALFAPHVLWELEHGFPTLEFVRTAQQEKIVPMSPLDYLGAQVVQANPLLAPLWLTGLGFLLFSRTMQPYRVFGSMYVILLGLFLVQQAKPYYLAPVYPILLASGAIALERASSALRLLRPVVAVWLVIAGIVVAPMTLPILPPDVLLKYSEALGLQAPREERRATAALPQHFADRFGWRNMAETVARVFKELPENDRRVAAIVTGNYGEAGAIDYFGPQLGLPNAISGHNNYWLWGYGSASGEVLITVGLPRPALENLCSSVEQKATIVSPYAMPYETDLPVYVCYGLTIPIAEAWRRLKRFV